MDWREGTETMTENEQIVWEAREGEVVLTVMNGKRIGESFYFSKDQAVNMLCGLAHVVGKLQ
jgi:hypothetical protein